MTIFLFVDFGLLQYVENNYVMFRNIRANASEEETIRTNLMRPAKRTARMSMVSDDKETTPRNRGLCLLARASSHPTKI